MDVLSKFSGSRSALLAKCKYPFRDDVDWREWPSSDERQYGNALHKLAELYVHGEPPDVSAVAETYGIEDLHKLIRLWIHMADWLEKNAHGQVPVVELKLALNLEERYARELKEDGHRNYSGRRPGETPMSIDLITRKDGKLIVRDWKTGHSADGYWPQIATNCLAVAWWADRDEVYGGILHATERGVDDTRLRLFDSFDLAFIADDLRSSLGDVPGSRPHSGPHCTEMYCGAFGVCPETIRAVEGVADLVPVEKLIPGHTLSLTMQSAEHCAWTLHRLRAYDAMAKQLKLAVEAFVGTNEHVVKDGILKQTYREMPRQSTAELMALARSKGATDDEIAACTHLSKEGNGIRVVRPTKGRAA